MESTVESPEVVANGGNEERRPSSFELVAAIIKMLEPLSRDEQKHIFQTVVTWLHLTDFAPQRPELLTRAAPQPVAEPATAGDYPFAGRKEVTPKEFMLEKDPKTDLERLTCLGYYLTHFRDQPYFKTEDLSKLNTEAAQRKFANAAFTAKNAVRDGFFVQAPKQGLRQLSALGEQYVQALPDHDAARLVRKRMRVHRSRSNSKKDSANHESPEEQ